MKNTDDARKMNDAISIMAKEIAARLDGLHSLWLYGSAVMGDFRLGWSDLDFIAFSNGELSEEAAQSLVMLRQELQEQYPENPYYRLFEGVILDLDEYRSGEYKRIVYWGTSGQRITHSFELDPFARYELARFGKCVCASADRSLFALPERAELVCAVRRHYEGIRQYARVTDEKLYSCGWLLDISRCIYTLRTGEVIAKTRAGEWALENGIFDDPAPLEKALEIRKNPLEYRYDAKVKAWLSSLGDTVQSYADALEAELSKADNNTGRAIAEQKFQIGNEHGSILWDIAAIRAHADEFPVRFGRTVELARQFPFRVNEEYAMLTEPALPGIMVELAEGKRMLIDGNHRLFKARKLDREFFAFRLLSAQEHKRFIVGCNESVYAAVIGAWHTTVESESERRINDKGRHMEV